MVNTFLGENFRPWVRVARKSAAEKIGNLVDQYEVQLEKARIEYAKAKERATTLRVQKHQAVAGVKVTEREIKLAEQEIRNAKTQLASLEDKLSSGQVVRLVSGRNAGPAELKNIVGDYSNRIQIAQEKVGYLGQILASRQARCQKLTGLEEQSPAAIQRLQNSVDYLARKVELYREVKRWANEESAAESELAGLYEQAQRTLEEAHAKLDQKLAEFDALLDASRQGDLTPASDPVTTDNDFAASRQVGTNRFPPAPFRSEACCCPERLYSRLL